jgi:hypothetical protein
MIKYIKYILHKLFYNSPIIIPENNKDILNIINNQYTCEVSFKLTENNEIDIGLVHADIQNSSTEEISVLAEKFANLIVLINTGLLKKQLIETIKYHKKQNMNNDKNTLLLDNVLFFNHLLQDELKAMKKEMGPLIKPSSVFKSLSQID